MYQMLDNILKTVKKTEEKVKTIKEYLNSDQDRKRKKLAEILEDLQIDFTIEPLISTEQDFIDIERKLKNEVVKRDLVSKLLLVGGPDGKDCLKRVMKKVLSNEVGTIFTFLKKNPEKKRIFHRQS